MRLSPYQPASYPASQHSTLNIQHYLFILLFPSLNLITVLNEEVYIVQTILEAVLLVAIDFEVLALAGSKIGHGLVRKIYLYLSLVILVDALKEFLQEFLTYHYWQYEVVQLVVLVDISEERADDNTEACTCDSPGSVLTGRTGAEVLTSYEDDATVRRVIHHEVWLWSSVGIITPVAEEVVAHTLLVDSLEEAGWYDLVCIYILQRKRNAA